jgi:hypothetical protein
MPTRYFKRLTYLTFGIFAAALSMGQSVPSAAQTPPYPWCSVGESLHCYYMTLQQCEETVDYHGFCDKNPDLAAEPASPVPKPQRRSHPR